MIGIIGLKRILAALILVGFNAVLGASSYLYLAPEITKVERELRTVRAQVADKQGQTEMIRSERGQIQERKAQFEDLKAAGFFNDQNRVDAQKRIQEIQKFTKVLAAEYTVNPAEIEKNDFVSETGHVLIDSLINMNVDALDDLDLYALVYWMENAFPGHVSVRSVEIKRNFDVNDTILREIGTGAQPAVMKGVLQFDWRSMLPEEQGGTDRN